MSAGIYGYYCKRCKQFKRFWLEVRGVEGFYCPRHRHDELWYFQHAQPTMAEERSET